MGSFIREQLHVSLKRFLGKVLSTQIEEPEKKSGAPLPSSIVAHASHKLCGTRRTIPSNLLGIHTAEIV